MQLKVLKRLISTESMGKEEIKAEKEMDMNDTSCGDDDQQGL